jgi:hypothetical protein
MYIPLVLIFLGLFFPPEIETTEEIVSNKSCVISSEPG